MGVGYEGSGCGFNALQRRVKVAVKVTNRSLEQTEDKDLIGSGGEAALNGGGHLPILGRAGGDKIRGFLDRLVPSVAIGKREGQQAAAIYGERFDNRHRHVSRE